MFEVLGKFAMKAADMLPGLGGLSFLGYYVQHTLGYSAVGAHAGGSMAWLQKLFGV